MLIQYAVTKDKREVSESIGRRLVASRIASIVHEPIYRASELKADEDVEISPRTGKPKRQYKRRDMRAED